MKEKYSYWEEIGGLFICNVCKHYTEEELDFCPKCKCKMIAVQKVFEEVDKNEIDKNETK